jgi:hypothetical protein
MTDAKAKTVHKPKVGRTVDEFRAAHDKNYIIPARIRAALEKLGDGWEYEMELMKLAGISTTDVARFRSQFEEHIVTVAGQNPKRIWAGTKKLAAQLRELAN